jgi:hypothetical protein
VSITSAEEEQFVKSLLTDTRFWFEVYGPWIGAVQPAGSPEPSGGWQWTTQEPFSYSDWLPDGPSNSDGVENRVHIGIYGPDRRTVGWNDISDSTSLVRSYIIEYDPPFKPRQATGAAQVTNGSVTTVTMTYTGWGYTNGPPVHFLGGGGSGATGVAIVQDGVVERVTITATGTGYTSVPRVLIAAPSGVSSLSIAVKQVHVNLNLILGYRYKLQTTTDLQTWTDTGLSFLATESTMDRTFDVTNTRQMFRVIQVP